MGVLFRAAAENFNPQVHTEENSLAVKMNKHFAVRKKSIELFQRYSKFTSLMYATGRSNRGIGEGKVTRAATKEMYDNAYRINYEGALLLPAFSYGAAVFGAVQEPGVVNPDMSGIAGVTYANGKSATTITTDTVGSLALKHDPANNVWGDKFNPNDSIVLGDGLGIMLIITDTVRKSADGSHTIVNFKTVGPEADFDPDHLNDGEVMTEGGSFFGQGSIHGYQRHTKNQWRINYSSIHRYTITMTGSAKQQKVAWIANTDNRSSRMWEFKEILKGEEIFHMMGELSARYSRISMDPASHSWYENPGSNQLTGGGFNMASGVTPPIIGDGWIPQIKDNAEFGYNPNNGLSYLYIQAMMMSLSNRSPAGSSGNTFVFVTDKIGEMVVDDSLKKLLNWGAGSGNQVNNSQTNIVTHINGEDTVIGFKLKRYNYLNNDIYVMEDELLSNPGQHGTNGGVTGAGHIYCLNTTPIDGVSNFELIARAKRGFLKKMVDGMHSFDPVADSGSKASSGFDGCSVHLLKECMAVLYDARSCGILKATAKYNGGALNGSTFLAANPDATGFVF